mmetsp:Transcript_13581/g.27799  ORF Transcript_13581/g.27799 Transcript_13581/m.27799 type:complete len:131 (-) Transcript_13581:1785-2177(-)|eukprot:CAMPEP_0184689620 /NCGR_PEP_ID=MMETSP0312-20130426/30753_1 /TAXON_ID=31354 /ORGANISM="Compsopogon coeruleus, Strain SAG 36.94" /LENGTH=130 /DNA_ID=CAMNT_0027146991 /DNA_START=150 /DNA_END=542 /DNA_ORIENTATION=+
MERFAAERNRMEGLVQRVHEIQQELNRAVESRSNLGAQLTENEMVGKELKLLGDDARVFKLVGPVLIRQEVEEARGNVAKRVDFIKSELARAGERVVAQEKKLEEARVAMLQGQQRMQELLRAATPPSTR